ncbi:hypothetical protein [Desulforamulus putei]|uniref:Uncharacterized protein n=1 Tax=Desulforamulus putei DSM 12395 TaxID=1121429 RepID=A0A1M4YN79_9FIRM|nr:hypothetical protein [Desulforamulus putei]SHF07240.1 hypothetical protein SAMN02745133_01750 [Desulforamulus putei DSM 12395]
MKNNEELQRKVKEELFSRITEAGLEKIEDFLNELEELIKKYSNNSSDHGVNA